MNLIFLPGKIDFMFNNLCQPQESTIFLCISSVLWVVSLVGEWVTSKCFLDGSMYTCVCVDGYLVHEEG